MGVLPAASNSHIPKPFRNLMTDPNSNIFEYYPEEFKIDLNGKKYSWQGRKKNNNKNKIKKNKKKKKKKKKIIIKNK